MHVSHMGSEMCMRDSIRHWATARTARAASAAGQQRAGGGAADTTQTESKAGARNGSGQVAGNRQPTDLTQHWRTIDPCSYTHLTLPLKKRLVLTVVARLLSKYLPPP